MLEFRSRTLGIWILAIGCCWTGDWASAQLFPQGRNQSDELFLLAPRAITRLLREGETSMAEERYTDAVNALGAILVGESEQLPDDLREQDFFIESGTRGVYQSSAKREAIRLLAELPAEGRRVLEIQFGVTARQQLEEALEGRNLQRIAEVGRKYPHTEAGYDAQLLLAQAKLTQGYPLAAASILQRLLQYPAARDRFGVELAVATAQAWGQAGKRELVTATMRQAREAFPGSSITLAGRQIAIDADINWLAEFQSRSDQAIRSSRQADEWLVAGGSAQRNATAEASIPLSTARWVKNIHSSIPERDLLQEVAETQSKLGNVLLPKFELRAIADTVITKTTDAAVLGIDFETGNTKWSRYFGSSPAPLKSFAIDRDFQSTEAISQELQNRVWGSSAFGRVACDSERFYYISTEGEQPIDEESMFRGQSGSVTTNYLEGVSIAKEGAILWRVGGPSGEDEPKLEGAFFLGPPLSNAGSLYALVEINGETQLVVLDPTNGQLRWSQQLVNAVFQPIGYDKLRQSQALSPTIADGVILCPTGVGAVVGVDLLTRSLRWGATYRTSDRGQANRFRGGAFGMSSSDYQPLARRWEDSAMIAQDGIVAVSPPDSELMFCLDVLSGEEVLSPQRRGYSRYVAGMYRHRVVVVGEQGISAISLENKRLAWDLEFPEGSVLAGKGLWQEDRMLIPLSNQEVLQVELDGGSIIDRVTVDQPLGNLFTYKEQLLSVNATSISAYYTRDSLSQQVEMALAEDQRDTWALNQKSQLVAADGDLSSALELLLTSYEIDQDNAETKYLLVETLLEALEADFERYADQANELDDVVEYGPQRFRFLQQIALGQIRSGNHPAAFARLSELMRERIELNNSGSQPRRSEIQLGRNHTVDSDVWIATALARSYSSASDDQREEMRVAVESELDKLRGTLATLRNQQYQFLRWLPAAGPSIIELAEEMMQGREQTAAEQKLHALQYSGSREQRSEALKLLQLPTESDLRLAGGTASIDAEAEDRSASSKRGDQPESLRDARAPLASKLKRLETAQWMRDPIEESIKEGLTPFGQQVEVVGQRYGRPMPTIALSQPTLIIKNRHGDSVGHLDFSRASADTNHAFNRTIVRGGLLLLETQSEVLAFDLYAGLADRSEALLWRHSLIGAAPAERFNAPNISSPNAALGITLHRRMLPGDKEASVGPLTPATLVIQDGTTIVGLDPMSGQQVWQRGGYGNDLRFAHDGLELAVVNPAEGVRQILDCRDGSLIRSEEFRGDWRHWFSNGPLMVDFKQAPDGTRINLRVWNALSDEVFQDIQLPFSARAAHCARRFLVVAEPNNHVHYFDLERPFYNRLNQQVESDLVEIAVERFEDRLVVLHNANRRGQRQRNISSVEQMVNGRVTAIRIDDGQPEWERPGKLYNMVLPVSQPRSSPFMSVYQFSNSSTGSAGLATFGLIDLRDGRLAFLTQALPVRAKVFEMRLRPDDQSLRVAVGDKNFTLKLGDGPRPPQPVFQFDPPTASSD